VLIALEIPDNDSLLEPMVDGHDVIDPMTPDQVAGEWLEYASSFHITPTARYELVEVTDGRT
jgi:hypothetical protein